MYTAAGEEIWADEDRNILIEAGRAWFKRVFGPRVKEIGLPADFRSYTNDQVIQAVRVLGVDNLADLLVTMRGG